MNRKLARIVKNLSDSAKIMVLAILESPIKWDLVCFYQTNPFSIHTARGLASMIGRRVDQVCEEAEELAALAVLKKICEDGETSSIYAYEPTSETASLLMTLVELYNEDHVFLDELRRMLREDSNE